MNLDEQVELARDRNASVEALHVLAESESELVREFVVGNHNTSEATYSKLAKDQLVEVRAGVASHTSDPVLILELSQDDDEWVRSSAARNPNVLIETLELLSRDESFAVRVSVATNSSVPSAVLEKLSADADYRVVRAVVHAIR